MGSLAFQFQTGGEKLALEVCGFSHFRTVFPKSRLVGGTGPRVLRDCVRLAANLVTNFTSCITVVKYTVMIFWICQEKFRQYGSMMV